MNLKGLEALRAFMEGGSLQEAAKRLRRTQPQVSRLLSALEDEVGFPLFNREKRRLIPTDDARTFYMRVQHALYSLDEARDEARRLREHQHQHVTILTAPHVVGALLVEPLSVMSEEVPTFTATIDSRSRLDIELWLGKEAFDLGITVMPIENPAVLVEPLVDVQAVAVMREDHPLATRAVVRIEDLVDLPLIANSPRTVMRQTLEAAFRRIGAEPDIRFETPNGQIACEMAARGPGLAVADGFVARSSLQPGMVIRPFEPTIRLGYVMMFPKFQTRTPLLTRLAGLIRQNAERQAGALFRPAPGAR
ncbi:LysR family transcriptional regulator [Acuticoccus sp. I52.16.1]|uniref:LysR family transcriptional regulator n=1 Tax=Acuticoccus sp. I52.16.1 TaxID=2928472 RepID=UPI001FD5CB5C|nr:LysR family transcriptional regulator [Acuticoccus sp. I52.16.1]UOM34387.1 LysR family transcriptional regulator [Acuticoccus sp. I52.16.1]